MKLFGDFLGTNHLFNNIRLSNVCYDENIYFKRGIIILRIDFNALRPIIRNKDNKSKKSTDSTVCLNEFINLDENIIDMIPVPSKGLNPRSEYFAQYAKGESMKDAGINDGDLLIFERTSQVDDGVIGCFCDEDNVATCKKYKELNGIIMLQPMNSEFEPIVVDPLKDNFMCLGKLKKVIKDFDWED